MFCTVLFYHDTVHEKQHRLHGLMPCRYCFVLDWLSKVCWILYYLILDGWLLILESG